MNSKPRRRMASTIGLLLLCLSRPGAGRDFQEDAGPGRIRIESALVTVPAIVRDGEGRFLTGLPPESFRLFEDGNPVPVSLFLTSEDPVKIVLLLDTSRSATTVLKKIKKAAERFLVQVRPRDMVMVAGFDSEMRELCPFSSDPRELKDAIRRARSGGAYTRMRDAVHELVRHRLRAATGRKAIVLLSDGQDQGSRVPAGGLLDAVASSNTLVYTIFYTVDPQELMRELFGVATRRQSGAAEWREREKQAAAYLEKLSDLSAGRFYSGGAGDFDRIFRQISEELRAQYLLGFYPEGKGIDGATHSLVVGVDVPGAIVRSRRSYRSAPGGP